MKKLLLSLTAFCIAVFKVLCGAVNGLFRLAFYAALAYVAWYCFDSISKKLDAISEQARLADWKFEHQFHPVLAQTNDLYTVEYMIQLGNEILKLTENRDPHTYSLGAMISNRLAFTAGSWGIGWKPVDENLLNIDRKTSELSTLWKLQFDKFFYSDPTQNLDSPLMNDNYKAEMREFLERANERAKQVASDLHISREFN